MFKLAERNGASLTSPAHAPAWLTARRQPAITSDIIVDESGFKALQLEWTELLANSDSDCLFLTWEWTYLWWCHSVPRKPLHIIAVRVAGRLMAIAPLADCGVSIRRMRPFRWLDFIASGVVGADYLSFIVRSGYEDTGLAKIAECLAARGRALELVRVEQSSATMRQFAGHTRKWHWRSDVLTTNYCPFAALSGLTWPSYLRRLDASHQRYLRRKLRKLYREFSVSLELATTEEQRSAGLGLFLDLHTKRWSSAGLRSDLDGQPMRNFHQDFSKISLAKGWLRLYTLRLNSAAAASIYLFKYHNVIYYYQIGYDPQYARYSVGMVIMALAIQQSIEEAVDEFDFLHDDEAYKYLWTDERRALVRIDAYPPGPKGRVARRWVRAKGWLKNLRRDSAR